jgi:signal transduction histidine kinase
LLVKLTTTPELVELVIEDNGAGFDPTQAFEGRYGLIGLNERARLMGGELHLCSGEGDGTQLYVSVPLNPPQESER